MTKLAKDSAKYKRIDVKRVRIKDDAGGIPFSWPENDDLKDSTEIISIRSFKFWGDDEDCIVKV